MKKIWVVAFAIVALGACDVQRRAMPGDFNRLNDAQRAANPGYNPSRDYLKDDYSEVGSVTGKAEISGAPTELGCGPVEMSARADGCEKLACMEARQKAALALKEKVTPDACKNYVRPSFDACQKQSCPE